MQIIYAPKENKYDKEIKETYAYTELLKDFNDGYGDVYLSLCNKNLITYQDFDITFALLEDSMIWIVPRAKKIQDWRLLATIFALNLWISFVVTFIFSVLIFKAIALCSADKQFHDIFKCFFVTYCIFLNTSCHILPKTFKLRVLCICFIAFALNINAFLQGKLYSNLSHPVYEKEITNTEELLDSGLPLIFNNAMALMFMFGGPVDRKVFDRYIPSEGNSTMKDQLQTLVEKQNFATVISEGILLTNPHTVTLFNKFAIISLPVTIFVKQNHILFETIDDFVRILVENGIVQKFVSDIKYTYALECYEHANCLSFNQNVIKLSIKNLQGALLLYEIGIVVACIVFFLEMCIWHFKKTLFKKTNKCSLFYSKMFKKC